MKYVSLGDRKASAIGLGTWQFGTPGWGWGRDFDEREAERIVRRALELGINLFDTAEVYGNGRSEEVLGRALRQHRHEAIIASKVWPLHLSRAGVRRAAEASLRRLGVEAIDLYQVHWPNPLVPLGWTMRGMRDLLDRGLVRQVGVSNFGLGQWRRAEALLGAPVISNQVLFHLLAPKPLEELVPYAQARGRVVIAYSPLAQGLLTGKYTPQTAPRGIRTANPLFLPQNMERVRPLLQALQEVAQAHGATPAQIALAWLVHIPHVIAIPGAKSVEQVEANAAAADIALSPQEWERLYEVARAVHPMGWGRSLLGIMARWFRM
jgi:aryl-alcohol dehydrogenase-like predicted oxidoreductase